MSSYERILLISLFCANILVWLYIARRLAIKENARANPSQLENVSPSMARMVSRPFAKKPKSKSPKINDDYAAWRKENE